MSAQGYANALYNLAMEQGLASGHPCVYQVREGTDKYIVVSNEEPTSLVLPLNVLWVHSDGGNILIWRRTSKTPSAPWQHSWVPETDYNSIFNTEPVWAPEDAPTPVIISQKGGQLNGPLYPVVNSTYEDTESAPLGFIRTIINGVRNSLMTMYQNMNKRVLYDDERIRALYSSLDSLKVRVNEIDYSKSQSYPYVQEDVSDVWVIEHGFDKSTHLLQVFVTDESGEIVCPAKTMHNTDGTTVLRFSELCSGQAAVFALKL